MSLRDYLDAAEALAPTDLHHAITRAAIYGGSLDTALLELGLVDPHGLEAILAAAHGLPTTPPELLAPRRRPWERLAPRWIEERLAAPLAALDDRLWIAVHPDLPSDALAQLWQEESALEVTVTAECCLRRVLAEQTGEALSARHAVLAATYLRTLRPPSAAASPFVDDDASPPPRADAPADDAGAAAPHASTDDAFPHADTASSEPAGDAASPPRAGEDADIAEAAPPAPPPEIRTFIPSTLRHAVPFPETPAPDDSDSARDPQIP
ncbi:MAG TPA: hypothetical protein PKW35_21400, partial [Nannocystaceae bacterium]|nr:hypothetical protein [Nannocystaceae bacterium]